MHARECPVRVRTKDGSISFLVLCNFNNWVILQSVTITYKNDRTCSQWLLNAKASVKAENMADTMLFQIEAFTRHYHKAEKLDNDYDKYNTYFAEMSAKLPRAIKYKGSRCRIFLNPRIKMYGFHATLRDRIMKHKGQDMHMVLHVGVFNRRDSLHGHSVLLVFDTLRQIQYYYDPLAYLGDSNKICAHMAVTPLVEGFDCKVVMASLSYQCIQRMIEPDCMRNTTCGLVCVLVALCFMYSTSDLARVVNALTQTCALNPAYMQKFILRFAAYYNEQVCKYDA